MGQPPVSKFREGGEQNMHRAHASFIVLPRMARGGGVELDTPPGQEKNIYPGRGTNIFWSGKKGNITTPQMENNSFFPLDPNLCIHKMEPKQALRNAQI